MRGCVLITIPSARAGRLFTLLPAGGLKTDTGPLFKNPMQFSIFSPAVSLSNLVAAYPRIAFSGSRLCSSQAALSCRSVLPVLSSFSGAVGVGCASGIDLLIRSTFPSASVFQVQPPISRAAFAVRSTRLIHWVQSGSGLLLAFPQGAASHLLRPSVSFRGFGSGSWGSVSLALGLSVPVLLFLPASSVTYFPAPSAIWSRFSYFGPSPCGGVTWLAQ